MKSYRFWLVMVAPCGALVAGLCAAVGVASGMGGDPGGGTLNGLMPPIYHALRVGLDTFMQQRSTAPPDPQPLLYPPTTRTLSSFWLAKHGEQPGRLVEDTIGCAVPAGLPFPGTGSPFHGDGLMMGLPSPPPTWLPPRNPPQGYWQPIPGSQSPIPIRNVFWPGNLSTDQTARMEDIHTCLITRLNYFGVTVPIFLSGPHVTPRNPHILRLSDAGTPPDDPSAYIYDEAIWLASYEEGTPFGPAGCQKSGQACTSASDCCSGVCTGVCGGKPLTLHVWPLGDLECSCGRNQANLEWAINVRVCSQLPSTGNTNPCNVQVHRHGDLSTYCDWEPRDPDHGVWFCSTTPNGPNKKPTIATRLGPCGWLTMYSDPSSTGPSPAELGPTRPSGIAGMCSFPWNLMSTLGVNNTTDAVNVCYPPIANAGPPTATRP